MIWSEFILFIYLFHESSFSYSIKYLSNYEKYFSNKSMSIIDPTPFHTPHELTSVHLTNSHK